MLILYYMNTRSSITLFTKTA